MDRKIPAAKTDGIINGLPAVRGRLSQFLHLENRIFEIFCVQVSKEISKQNGLLDRLPLWLIVFGPLVIVRIY